ncbi:MAG: S41 family peptidase [Anaerobacillus sp.]|uniref:S41 family peptidase n=1 Tax=Anaerobacillus sp. TaxID=1872506 RepID=UPI003919391E
MLKKKVVLIIIFIFLLLVTSVSYIKVTTNSSTTNENKETQQLENLIAFSKVYGYVRYFHPSDEAELVDWDRFVVYGISEVKDSRTEEELARNLLYLFEPIAPTIQIIIDKYSFKEPFLDKTENTVSWQHEGVKTPHSTNVWNNFIYNSMRVQNDGEKLFEQTVAKDELIEKKISNSIFLKLPLALYTKDGKTIGNTDETFKALESLLKQLNSVITDNADNVDVRLAGSIITWNFFQHFYPYFEEVNVNWESELVYLLEDVIQASSQEKYVDALNFSIAKLNDGHAGAWIGNRLNNATLPFYPDKIDGKLVVTVVSSNSPFQVGDILLTKDNREVIEILSEEMRKISGSKQWKSYLALDKFVRGDDKNEVEFEVDRNGNILTISTKYEFTTTPIDRFNRKEKFLEIEEGIYYINATDSIGNYFEKNLEQLKEAEAIIFDIRGYIHSDVWNILPYLSNETLKSPIWKIPQIIYPDNMNLVGHREDGRWEIESAATKLSGKLIFLTDGGAISASETFLGIIEDHNLGLIVGGATAGANGNMNILEIPGKVTIGMTGMKVVKGDRSQHHIIGIKPTVTVIRSFDGVLNEKDEYIEKALELIKSSN